VPPRVPLWGPERTQRREIPRRWLGGWMDGRMEKDGGSQCTDR